MSDETRQDPFNPSQYVEHVTRTHLLLEALAKDVRGLLDSHERQQRAISDLERDLAVFKTSTKSDLEGNRDAVSKIAESQQWLRRLVISGVIGGVLSGLLALVWAALK